MPAARQLQSQQEQLEELNNLQQKQLRLDEITQELGLYDPSGPWRFFEKRLKDLEARALAALETGSLEEVLAQRIVLTTVRDLLKTPERLRREREQLEGDIDE